MKRLVALTVLSFAILTLGFESISSIYAQLTLESPGLSPNPWAMFGHDLQHTGRSQFIGLQSAEMKRSMPQLRSYTPRCAATRASAI